MVGVDHSDLLVIAFRQHGDIILPQVVAVDQVDVPLLTQLGQGLGRLAVKTAGHGQLPGGHSQRLQPLHQQSTLVVGEEGLNPAVGREIFHQGLHIPLGARLAGVVQKIEYIHGFSPL